MKKTFILFSFLVMTNLLANEKLFVIERETNSVAIIENEKSLNNV